MAQYTSARSRTKEKIERSFWELYTDVNFKKRVRVSDITQRAGIHRSTFYQYFDSVDEIFDGIKENQLTMLREVCTIPDSQENFYRTFLKALEQLFRENRIYLKPLLAEYHSSSFSLAYRQMLKENLRRDAGLPIFPTGSKEEAILDMILNGFIEMLICSLESDLISVEENFQIAYGIMESGVKTVLKGTLLRENAREIEPVRR